MSHYRGGRGRGGGGGRGWMRHLPAHVRDKVARQMERTERLTPEEWEAEKERKAEDKRLKLLYDPDPAELELPEREGRELRAAVDAIRAQKWRNIDFYNPPADEVPEPKRRHLKESVDFTRSQERKKVVREEVDDGDGMDVDGSAATSAELLAALEAKASSERYRSMQEYRQKLPAWPLRDQIVRTIRQNQVVVISGETGCGKTTQVPQFLLDDAIRSGGGPMPPLYAHSRGGFRPLVWQNVWQGYCTYGMMRTFPSNKVSVEAAGRIQSSGEAQIICPIREDERDEEVGNTVGFQIRLERKASAETTRLLFCTTGILLRKLQLNPTLKGVSHVILDEVHERSIESDFLLIILRDLLPQRLDLKVILMSATMNSAMFAAFFPAPCPIVEIPGFTFPVDQYFLEDAIEITGFDLKESQAAAAQSRGKRRDPAARKRKVKVRRLEQHYEDRLQEVMAHHADAAAANGGLPRYSDATLQSVAAFDEEEIPLELVEELVLRIDEEEGEGAVLIFVPGWEQISSLHQSLSSYPQAQTRWKLYPLHSQLPMDQQREIFNRPPPGIRKVVIATNIAESSITIDDVVYVIDTGKHKEKTYDAGKKLCMLMAAWVSRASATQRKGRAGRVQPGKCWHLFPRKKLDELEPFQLPEIVRTPLESLCLQVRALGVARHGAGGISEFLKKAVTPPSDAALDNALDLLLHIGAIAPDEHLTVLGKHLCTLPIEPTIGKALVYSALLRCLDPVLSLVSLLSFKSPFVLPLEKKDEANRAKMALAEDSASDHKALLNAYEGWREAQRAGRDRDFCWRNFLSGSTLRMVHEMRKQFHGLLEDAGLLDGSAADHNANSKRWPVVKAALLSGLYPKVVRVDFGRKRATFFTTMDGRLKIHPGSVNAFNNHLMQRWLMYFDKVKTEGGLYVYDTSEVSPLAMLVVGAGRPGQHGRLIEVEQRGRVFLGVEDWVYFDVRGGALRDLVEVTRDTLTYLLACKLTQGDKRDMMPQGSDVFIEALCRALVAADEIAESAGTGLQHHHGRGGGSRGCGQRGGEGYEDDDDDEDDDEDGSVPFPPGRHSMPPPPPDCSGHYSTSSSAWRGRRSSSSSGGGGAYGRGGYHDSDSHSRPSSSRSDHSSGSGGEYQDGCRWRGRGGGYNRSRGYQSRR